MRNGPKGEFQFTPMPTETRGFQVSPRNNSLKPAMVEPEGVSPLGQVVVLLNGMDTEGSVFVSLGLASTHRRVPSLLRTSRNWPATPVSDKAGLVVPNTDPILAKIEG